MKVVAINGSPKKEGNTYYAINIVADELKKEDIEVEIINVGNKSVRGCAVCGKCIENRDGKCIIDDGINEWIEKLKEADGIILGSPVYFSSVSGNLKGFLDRAFFVSSANGGMFRHKVGAAVVAVRRSGGIPTFQELNNYLTYSEMLIPASNYWNVIHGRVPGEVLKDEEGMQVMRVLGKNMAWLLKLVENGKGTIEPPKQESKVTTSFIR